MKKIIERKDLIGLALTEMFLVFHLLMMLSKFK
jgi:hypothetical protein